MESRRLSLLPILAAAGALAFASTASADTLAAVEVPSATGTDLDLSIVNATTGTRSALPAGVNTAADELHPSFSADGSKLVFLRADLAAGTRRIIEVDLATGRQADLFTSFEAADTPFTPFMTAAGHVLTGRRLTNFSNPSSLTSQPPSLIDTDATGFPNPPFPKRFIASQKFTIDGFGRTLNPVESGGTVAYAARLEGGTRYGNAFLMFPGGAEAAIIETGIEDAHPALAVPNPGVVAYERRFVTAAGGYQPATIGYRYANTRLDGPFLFPPLVNVAGADESRPAFTHDNRYLAFVRHGVDGHDRLLLFDTDTQTLVNPSGVDLGALPIDTGIGQRRRIDGNVSLFQRPLIVASAVSATSIITVNLLQAVGVGILVQRVVGHHRFLRRRVPTLKTVGRVPFGRKHKGHVRIRWNGRVGGHRLRPGTYLITPRAVTSKLVVRDLGKPRIIKIKRR